MLSLSTLIIATQLAAGSPLLVSAGRAAECSQGESFLAAGKYQKAQQSLWQCVVAGDATQDNGLHLAWTYRELKNYGDGIRRVTNELKGSGADENLLYLAAFLHFREVDLETSVAFLNRAYRITPNDWRIHQLYALNFVQVDWSAAAEQELKRAIQLKPDMPELYYQLARYYYTMNQYDESILVANRALAIASNYSDLYDNLGMDYAGLGDKQNAEKNFKRAIEINRSQNRRDEWPLIDYGAFLEVEDAARAQTVLEEALEMNPNNATANFEMGLTMRDLQNDSKAVERLTKAIEIDPTYTSAYYILATVLRRDGERQKADFYIGQYLERKKQDKKSGEAASVLSMHHR